MTTRRILQPRTTRNGTEQRIKDQTKLFLHDDIDTQQWSENIENDPALPPSTARIRSLASQRGEKKRRLHEEEEADRIVAEEAREVAASLEMRSSTILHHNEPGQSNRKRAASTPGPIDDLIEETLNHPEYPHDLDPSRKEDEQDALVFASLAAVERVGEIGKTLQKVATQVVKGADDVDIDSVVEAGQKICGKSNELERSIKRLQRNVIAGGAFEMGHH